MKKFLAIFLVLTLLFSFAACNKDGKDDESSTTPSTEQTEDNGTTNKAENPSSNKNEENTTAEPFVNPNLTEPSSLFSLIDVNEYKVEERKPNSSATSGVTVLAKQYALKADKNNDISNGIRLDSTTIVLGETYLKELFDAGWKVSGNADANTAVKTGEKATVIINNEENKVVQLNVKNESTNTVAVSDCTIVKISVLKEIKNQNWLDFTIGDTVNTASATYSSCVTALGEPNFVNVSEYYNGNEYSHCKVTMIFRQTINGSTYTITIGGEDKAKAFVLNSCVVEVI